jgi:TRAP-type C4-dicarboxylate transport system permease small subunit
MGWKQIASTAARIFDKINEAIIFLLRIVFVIGFLAVCISVFTRYLLNMPILWVIGSTEYMLAAIGFLGAAWVLKMSGHVSQDTVINLLNPAARTALKTITSFIGGATCFIIALYAAITAWDYHHRQIMNVTTIIIPVAPMLGFVAVGFLLLSIQFARDTYKHLSIWVSSILNKGLHYLE